MNDSSPYLGNRLARRGTDRRGFLCGAGALAAGLLLPLPARAEGIHQLRGDVRVNGQRIDNSAKIKAGDHVVTTATGFVVFAIGRDAFMLRERSELRLDANAGNPLLIDGLRLLTGALGAVFGKRAIGGARIIAPTVTAGIRGTGVYLETRGEGTYFCTCYGTVALAANANERDRETVTTTRHNNPRLILNTPRDGQLFVPAAFETHTDAEMDMLEKCVDRRAPWIAK
ncbi:MAG: hypothetical protein IPK29_01505 [Betaproteobacteria bacterium]|nr:hypothetical protein [Betaproteobacteria bacterium]